MQLCIEDDKNSCPCKFIIHSIDERKKYVKASEAEKGGDRLSVQESQRNPSIENNHNRQELDHGATAVFLPNSTSVVGDNSNMDISATG